LGEFGFALEFANKSGSDAGILGFRQDGNIDQMKRILAACDPDSSYFSLAIKHNFEA